MVKKTLNTTNVREKWTNRKTSTYVFFITLNDKCDMVKTNFFFKLCYQLDSTNSFQNFFSYHRYVSLNPADDDVQLFGTYDPSNKFCSKVFPCTINFVTTKFVIINLKSYIYYQCSLSLQMNNVLLYYHYCRTYWRSGLNCAGGNITDENMYYVLLSVLFNCNVHYSYVTAS